MMKEFYREYFKKENLRKKQVGFEYNIENFRQCGFKDIYWIKSNVKLKIMCVFY